MQAMTSMDDRRANTEQYRTPANLNARIRLHRRFSTNPRLWNLWVFDRLLESRPPDTAQVLELGCGPGHLWRENLDRLPPGWRITLADFSPGMLADARRDLPGRAFQFEQLDAQALPHGVAQFNLVIANHMLYHVADRHSALAHIRRILKPDGRLFAATNGQDHMHELWVLLRQCMPDLPGNDALTLGFNLQNGGQQLKPWFGMIRMHVYADSLVVTEAEPLIAYALSDPRFGIASSSHELECVSHLVRQQIDLRGAIHITKSIGLFEAVG